MHAHASSISRWIWGALARGVRQRQQPRAL